MDRALLLAHVQEDLASQKKPWAKTALTSAGSSKTDNVKAGTKGVPGDFWKERQLKEYRRANGLCFQCGDKFDPTHVCAVKPAATVHALSVEDHAVELTPAILNLLELQDIEEAR